MRLINPNGENVQLLSLRIPFCRHHFGFLVFILLHIIYVFPQHLGLEMYVLW